MTQDPPRKYRARPLVHWNWWQRSIAVIFWCSFLTAGGALLGLFALDQQTTLLGEQSGHDLAWYSWVFVFFWLIGAVAATLSTWMIRTERRKNQFPSDPSSGAA